MAMTLITTNTSSNAASSSFTSSIDSTYKLYIFKFYDVNPATNSVYFEFQANASSQSGYNETITSTHFAAEHQEDDGGAAVAYWTAGDQAQGTAYQRLTDTIGNGGDEGCAGELHLFNPSNTTYVKHFYATVQQYHEGDRSICSHVSGFFNFTAALTNIDFKMSSGNMDAVIKMYGVG